MSTHVLTGLCLAAACTGCRMPAPDDRAVVPREVIIGRATTRSGIAILTNEPALVRVDQEGRVFRTNLQKPPAKLWGLGSIGNDLFTTAGFIDLVRISTDGTVEKRARFANPIANMVDTAGGMAAQLAVDLPGAPLLMSSDAAARLAPLPGVRRRPLGLSRAEEGVLHLLSCSVPPRVICWLPGARDLLSIDETGTSTIVTLDSFDAISPVRLIAQPARRVIHDALAMPDGGYLVLGRHAGASKPALRIFDPRGRVVRDITMPRPVRMLLDLSERGVRAIDAEGRLIEVLL